jgi:hypothetical protein
MSNRSRQRWSFTAARVPAPFAACRETAAPAAEHALAEDATLCGIGRKRVTVYRHLFSAERAEACSECRVRAAAAPAGP